MRPQACGLGSENQPRINQDPAQEKWTQRTWGPASLPLPLFILILMLLAIPIAMTFLKRLFWK